MNNNHYPVGYVIGFTCEMPVELILLHVKSIGGVLERGAMKQNEKTKTTENMGRKGRKNYEQNLERVSRRGKREAGENRPEHIREGKLYGDLQDAVTVQINNKEEIRK